MEQLFLLSEKITGELKKALSIDREYIGIFNFDNALINNSSFEIFFSSIDTSIKISLNTHHLDMPWSTQVIIETKQKKICLNNLMRDIKKRELVYEVYPNLLRDPDTLGLELAVEIGVDIFKYLMTKSV